MKKRSITYKSITEKSGSSKVSSGKNIGPSSRAYGEKISLCINTGCTLRKRAGGCLGFEGCPGFKAR